MRKNRMRAAKKRTPPVMPTPRPTLRPVLEEEAREEVAPFSSGAPELEEALDEEVVVVKVDAEVTVLEEAVLLVDVLGVVEVPPTYSTSVGTDAAT
jgi:hypothetical protein